MKILSREITHKTDVGGVALDLGSEQAVVDAVRAMTGKVCNAAPGAQIDGFVVQPMIKRPHAVELILGAAEDPVFGPILMVGHGGVAAEVIDDKALALPPLDPVLAEDALSRTRVDRLLRGYRDRPPAARAAPSATPWCGCRSSSPTSARSPSSTSIRCWPTPRA